MEKDMDIRDDFEYELYEKIYWDSLDDDEMKMIENMPLEKVEKLIKDQIKLLTVRERRLLKRMEEQRRTSGQRSEGKPSPDTADAGKQESGGGEDDKNAKKTAAKEAFEAIQKLEAELTRVQARKTHCIEALNKLRMELQRISEKAGGETAADDWIAALTGGGKDDKDSGDGYDGDE